MAAPATAGEGITIAAPGGLSATLVGEGPADARLAAAGSAVPGHFFHPIRLADGTVLTELYPADHIHHRGLFWGWRQLVLDGRPIANNWLMTGMTVRPAAPEVSADGRALTSVAIWHADGRDVLEERLSARVAGNSLHLRLELRALVPGLALGGSPDDKEYGGISLRLVQSETLNFHSRGRALSATPAPVVAGGTMRFSWDADGPAQSVTLSCTANGRPLTRWILRRETSMQNCVWPGGKPLPLPMNRPVILGAVLAVQP